jgi:hypothetical protein
MLYTVALTQGVWIKTRQRLHISAVRWWHLSTPPAFGYRCNLLPHDQSGRHNSKALLTILSRTSMTKTRVWITEFVYWIFTTISSYTLKITVTVTHVTSHTKSSNSSSGHIAVPLELLDSIQFKVKVSLRLAVYRQSICLGVKLLETHDQNFFFSPPTNPYDISPYVTSSLTRRWVCLLWICLAFRQVYISHI